MRGSTCVCLLLAGFACQPARAAEPQFLGRTHQQWSVPLAADSPPQKSQAAWAISQLAIRDINPASAQQWLDSLTSLTQSDDSAVRYWGVQGLARALQKLDESDAARSAGTGRLAQMLNDQAAGPRLAAAEAVATLGDPATALPVLVAALSSPQEAVRIQAIAALERLGEAARPAMPQIRSATTDSSEYVKRISAQTLKNLSNPPK